MAFGTRKIATLSKEAKQVALAADRLKRRNARIQELRLELDSEINEQIKDQEAFDDAFASLYGDSEPAPVQHPSIVDDIPLTPEVRVVTPSIIDPVVATEEVKDESGSSYWAPGTPIVDSASVTPVDDEDESEVKTGFSFTG